MNICDIMTEHVISIDENEPILAAARLLKRNNIGSLPVQDSKGRLKGVVTDRDIVLRCVASNSNPKDLKVSEIMSRNVVSVKPFEDACQASKQMAKNQIRRLPVTDNGILVGMVSLGDIAKNDDLEADAYHALEKISSNFRKI